MVGSLFSKRPRVTGSNRKTSCLDCTGFSKGSSGVGCFTGNGFFFGAITRGSDFLITDGGGGGGAVSVGTGCSNGIRSADAETLVATGSATVSILGGISSGCSKTGGGGVKNAA